MTDLPRTQALRCFSTVAQEGTVSRAASLLNLTQPAVSLQLAGLRDSLTYDLPMTQEQLPCVRSLVAPEIDFRIQDFIAAANSLKQAQRGRLRVGTILDPEFTRLGPFVRSLTASSHETEIILRHGMNDDLLTQIGKGELDVGYYIEATPNRSSSSQPPCERPLEGGKFQLAPLMRYIYRVIAPADWSDKVLGKDWADLAALPWLATPSPSAHRRLLDNVFQPLGCLPKRVGFTDQEEATIDFVDSLDASGFTIDSVLSFIPAPWPRRSGSLP